MTESYRILFGRVAQHWWPDAIMAPELCRQNPQIFTRRAYVSLPVCVWEENRSRQGTVNLGAFLLPTTCYSLGKRKKTIFDGLFVPIGLQNWT